MIKPMAFNLGANDIRGMLESRHGPLSSAVNVLAWHAGARSSLELRAASVAGAQGAEVLKKRLGDLSNDPTRSDAHLMLTFSRPDKGGGYLLQCIEDAKANQKLQVGRKDAWELFKMN